MRIKKGILYGAFGFGFTALLLPFGGENRKYPEWRFVSTATAASVQKTHKLVQIAAPIKLLSGTSHPKLATEISQTLGIPLLETDVKRFADNEVSVQIHENVRGGDVFVIQSTCRPANDHLMELFVILDTLKRASAGRVTVCMPYFGYAPPRS